MQGKSVADRVDSNNGQVDDEVYNLGENKVDGGMSLVSILYELLTHLILPPIYIHKGWVENDCGYTNWDVLNNLYSATWIILCMPGTI